MEEINEKILNVFGYTSILKDNDKSIDEIFNTDYCRNPEDLIHGFIKCCTIKEFEELKIMLNGNDMSTNF